jgi:hypothetical protein
MRILIHETGEIQEIHMTDQNGQSYETDYILNNISHEEWEECSNADISMSAENFNWWAAHCASYQDAQHTLAEKRENASNLIRFDEELNMALNVEFNDRPNAIMAFCESYED